MSVTAARRFRAAGVAAGLKSTRRARPRPRRQRRPRPPRRRGLHQQPRRGGARSPGRARSSRDGRVDAVVLNSGGANACTGAQGFADTHPTAERSPTSSASPRGDVAVCSTGLIGELLPMDLLEGVERAAAALDADGGDDAATAIKTTDTVTSRPSPQRDGWTVGGMAKGAGMLAPALATMLVVVTTDAVVARRELDAALRAATALTFDRIDSDGCQSTNDTVLLLASAPPASRSTPRLTDRGHRGLCQPGPPAHRRRRGRPPRHRDRGADRGHRGRRAGGRPVDRPQQPVQVRRLRQRPQLGPGARRRRHDRRPPSTRTSSTCRSTACRSAARAAWARTAPSSTSPSARCTSWSTCTPATAVTVWTNDLTHDYVHENSAYSS